MPVPLMPRTARPAPLPTRALPLSKGGLLAFAAVVAIAATYIDPVAVVHEISAEAVKPPALTASEPVSPVANQPAAPASQPGVQAH